MSLRRIATGMGDFRYGAKSVGRLTFRTEAEARGAAAELGLDGTHRHEQDHDNDGTKETVRMPGKNHRKLNKELRKRNLPPAPKPSKKEMEEMKEMEMGVAGVFDMGLKGDKDGDGDMEIY